MLAASTLIGGLGGEKERWTEQSKEFEAQIGRYGHTGLPTKDILLCLCLGSQLFVCVFLIKLFSVYGTSHLVINGLHSEKK